MDVPCCLVWRNCLRLSSVAQHDYNDSIELCYEESFGRRPGGVVCVDGCRLWKGWRCVMMVLKLPARRWMDVVVVAQLHSVSCTPASTETRQHTGVAESLTGCVETLGAESGGWWLSLVRAVVVPVLYLMGRLPASGGTWRLREALTYVSSWTTQPDE